MAKQKVSELKIKPNAKPTNTLLPEYAGARTVYENWQFYLREMVAEEGLEPPTRGL